jgi:[ribosomal protein S5]-alanine N-acetyltransferase
MSFEWGDELPKIEGQQLRLRGLAAADAEAIFAVFGDPEVVRFWSAPPLVGVLAAGWMIDEIRDAFAARRLFQWGICLRETGELLGTCTLYQLDRAHRRAELGIALRRSAWGRGYAREALELLIAFSFRKLDLHRLEADIDPNNAASLRLFERQGFRREGYLRQRWHHLGEIHDAIFLGLLRPEWLGPGHRAADGP